VLVQTPFSHRGALEPCTGRDYSGPANRPKDRPDPSASRAAERYRKCSRPSRSLPCSSWPSASCSPLTCRCRS